LSCQEVTEQDPGVRDPGQEEAWAEAAGEWEAVLGQVRGAFACVPTAVKKSLTS